MRKIELKRKKTKLPNISLDFSTFFKNLLALKKFTILLVIAIIAIIIGLDLNKFAYSNAFDCSVEFEGIKALSKEDLKNILIQLNSSSSDRFNFFKIEPYQIGQLLTEYYNRIKQIKIIRTLDRKMKIIIKEREPVAIIKRYSKAHKPFYLHISYDKKIFQIEKNSSEKEVRLPLIEGLETLPFNSTDFLRRLDIALKIINKSNKQGLDIDKIKINEYGTGIVYLKKGKYKVILGSKNIDKKIEKLEQILYSDAVKKYNVFDLRFFPKVVGKRS